ncbi:hypothetical protein M0R45_011415 [Rubus argutus]|uniref:Uncharacterized protein n=1 Tax=Rubus argutus TaxID=59490 RepID=A0AAW1YBJ9_RUBAR
MAAATLLLSWPSRLQRSRTYQSHRPQPTKCSAIQSNPIPTLSLRATATFQSTSSSHCRRYHFRCHQQLFLHRQTPSPRPQIYPLFWGWGGIRHLKSLHVKEAIKYVIGKLRQDMNYCSFGFGKLVFFWDSRKTLALRRHGDDPMNRGFKRKEQRILFSDGEDE